jgi:beta-mannosidase
MNMLRVGGTMVYESDDFYDLCDERGVLVWQDAMFANMDYPDDSGFRASVTEEVRQNLSRLQGRPSLALVCGGSEVEQQAAMWGADRSAWSPPLSHELLPALVRETCPGVFYWPSSAHGGAFPHQASSGSTSYYGVGAYLRPLEDARRSEVRFASECLAFANVPATGALPGGPSVRAHHPAWKARTPRDLGAGWDFDDVRDHYVGRLFGVDPVELRSVDHERYLTLGRAAPGEVMAAVFAEWRRARSTCAGGLVWFLRDLWPGAGWGILDAAGVPKSVYHYLRRTLQPVGLSISDEGTNGLAVHAVNERPEALEGELEIVLYNAGETIVGRGARALSLRPREAVEIPALELFDNFQDLSHAYRFGPPLCDLVVATIRTGGASVAEAFHFPVGRAFPTERDLGLAAMVAPASGRDVTLTVSTRRFAQAIAIEVDGFLPDDDHFHLAPGGRRAIRLVRAGAGRGGARGTLRALNASAGVTIVVPDTGAA